MRLVLVGAVSAVLAAALAARAEDAGADQAGSPPAGMCRTVVLKPCETAATGAKKPKKKASANVHRTAKGTAHKKRAPAGEQLAAKAPATMPAALEVGNADTSAVPPADSAAPAGGGGVSGSDPETSATRVALDFAGLQRSLAMKRWPRQEVSLFGGAPRPPEVMQAGFGLLVERRFAR